ncbi:MAG TPA: methyltransferase domain-containing protein [Nonomuraea sp.]|nr:methyltransferase domain-containing protein [Nonomuraea sp.]
MTAEKVARYYDEASELISADLGGGLHFGYWKDLPQGGSMAEASRRMTQLMIDKLGVGAGRRVLDVGCGTGGPALDLAAATGAEVVGIDLNERHVRLAGELAGRRRLADRVSFHRGDAARLAFASGSFDGAWMLESFFHMPDQARVLREIARVLRPGGRLAIANLVQRTPLSDERNAALEELWRVGHVAALLPLADYPALLADCGLALEDVLDISDHTTRQTFAAIRELHAARLRAEASSPDAPVELKQDMDGGMELFSATPEIGFAIVVATRP